MNILGVDYGRRRVGFAVGNSENRVAMPLTQVERKNNSALLRVMKKLVDDYGIQKIVMGYPLHRDGSRSAACDPVDQLIRFLEARLHLPVERMDEHLSSFEADENLKAVLPGHRLRKKSLDSVAAQVILQSYLNRP